MIPGFGFIQGVIQIRKIAEEEKKIKADKEDEFRRLVERRYAKHCGAKINNLYAEMLNGVKMTEEKVRGKKFKEVCYGVGASDSAKLGKDKEAEIIAEIDKCCSKVLDKAVNERQAEIIIEQENMWSEYLDNAILDACIKEYGAKGDKKFIVTEEGLKPVKVELDIKITKAQGRRWLKVIEDYSMSGECDFRDLNGVMNELSALIGDDDED